MSAPYGTQLVEQLDEQRGWIGRNLVRTSHVLTLLLGAWRPRQTPLVFVVAYPKSGNTWTGQLLADYLELPLPRNPLFPIGFPAVFLTHHCMRPSFPRGVYLVRDGRDILTSQFFYERSWQRRAAASSLGRRARDARDIAAFVEWQLTAKKPASTYATWPAHVRSYLDCRRDDFPLLSYEQLQQDGAAALARVVAQLTGEEPDREKIDAALAKFSFARQTGRTAGAAAPGKWARKGAAGDWVNHFTPAAAEAFDHYAGDVLVELGYESDRGWVEAFRRRPSPPAAEADRPA